MDGKRFKSVALVFCISPNEASESCLQSPVPVADINEDSEKSLIFDIL